MQGSSIWEGMEEGRDEKKQRARAMPLEVGGKGKDDRRQKKKDILLWERFPSRDSKNCNDFNGFNELANFLILSLTTFTILFF
jgi:hypothetical protein